MSKPIAPCIQCGTLAGQCIHSANRPSRFDGRKLGIDGVLCWKCYRVARGLSPDERSREVKIPLIKISRKVYNTKYKKIYNKISNKEDNESEFIPDEEEIRKATEAIRAVRRENPIYRVYHVAKRNRR